MRSRRREPDEARELIELSLDFLGRRMPDNELVTFELDENGKVVRIKKRSDYLFPIEE